VSDFKELAITWIPDIRSAWADGDRREALIVFLIGLALAAVLVVIAGAATLGLTVALIALLVHAFEFFVVGLIVTAVIGLLFWWIVRSA
jgi:hypothetical protein